MTNTKKNVLLDGSMLMIESLARAGGDVFIGYPITPANLLYQYGSIRFPVAIAAPDEITTLQWMSGFATAGKIPVTATSFPGFALMVESINMAYMMELPMVIILAQRLGPSTGTATMGAQGDLTLVHGMISGGYPLPTMSVSSVEDCWTLPAEALKWAVEMLSPVILLTSKEDTMTHRSLDISSLPEIREVDFHFYDGYEPYESYKPNENLIREFLPVGNPEHQVRITASTHDQKGILQNSTPESLENTKRLQYKLEKNIDKYTFYELDEQNGSEVLIVSYGITAQAARESVDVLRERGKKVSLFIPKTLVPVPPIYWEILERYEKIVIAEENLSGQYKQILYGDRTIPKLRTVNAIGRMISPDEIVREVGNV